MGGCHAPSTLLPGKKPRKRARGPRSGLEGYGKSRPPPGFDPVASRYTDYAIPAQLLNKGILNNFCNVPANCALHICYQHS